MRKLIQTLGLVAIVITATTTTRAAPGDEAVRKPREITATGTSQATLHPDRARLQFTVESRALQLQVAKQENDKRIAAIFALAKENGLTPDEISANYAGVEPRYRKTDDGREFLLGYTVNRAVTLTLHDLGKYEELLAGLFQLGITTLSRIEYLSSHKAEFDDRILVEATKEARRKAELMATALGVKLGKVLVIQPNTGFQYRSYNGQAFSNSGSFNLTRSGNEADGSPESPGLIQLEQSVTVTFELE